MAGPASALLLDLQPVLKCLGRHGRVAARDCELAGLGTRRLPGFGPHAFQQGKPRPKLTAASFAGGLVPADIVYGVAMMEPGELEATFLYVGAGNRGQVYKDAVGEHGGPQHASWADVPSRLRAKWTQGWRLKGFAFTWAELGAENGVVFALRTALKGRGVEARGLARSRLWSVFSFVSALRFCAVRGDWRHLRHAQSAAAPSTYR